MIERLDDYLAKNENLPTLSHNVQDDFLHTYPCGKVVKSFKDKRKRDIIIKDQANDITSSSLFRVR